MNKTTAMSTIKVWNPSLEKELPDKVSLELSILWRHLEPGIWLEHFDWDDEDNEYCPAIAEYVSDKYNEYHFIITFEDWNNV